MGVPHRSLRANVEGILLGKSVRKSVKSVRTVIPTRSQFLTYFKFPTD